MEFFSKVDDLKNKRCRKWFGLSFFKYKHDTKGVDFDEKVYDCLPSKFLAKCLAKCQRCHCTNF